MSKYIIVTIEKGKTSTGIERAIVSLESIEGQVLTGVTLWKSSWPNFEALAVSLELEGHYVEKQNGQYLNKNLYPLKTEKPKGGGNVVANMERKEKSIEKTLDRKEDSYKVSGTARDAVMCAIAEYTKKTNDLTSLEELITKWRAWLWNEYDKEDKDFPPFND